MTRLLTLSLLCAALLVAAPGCGNITLNKVDAPDRLTSPSSVDHSAFTDLLSRRVDERGRVDYRGLQASGELTPYVETLAAIDPENLSEDERLAYWINVYNANTLKLIVDNYPTKSITKLVPFAPLGLKIFVPKNSTGVDNSPFDQTFIRAGGRELSLNDVEHGIIRKEFSEPRIHFALVCAAVSCPPLRREAYTGPQLDAQLDHQARAFLMDTSKNQIPSAPGKARVSKILDWYGGDFGDDAQEVQQYLARYFDGEVKQTLEKGGYDLSYLPYNWDLNDQATE